MAEKGNLNHIELYRQNVGKDDIKVSILKGYKLPALIIATEELHDSDALQLKATLDLKKGEYFLYIQFKNQLMCIGNIDKTLNNFCCIQNAVRGCTVLEATKDDVQTVVTLEDMVCTIILFEDKVKENPELFVDYIKSNPSRYKQTIENNQELFA